VGDSSDSRVQTGLLNQTEEAALPSMPAWIRLGAFSLLVLVLSITGLIYFSHADTEQIHSLVSLGNSLVN
jgi:hypothetical protein